MLEAGVISARVKEVGHTELVDVPQALEWPRVDQIALATVEVHERVYRISDFVHPLGHATIPPRRSKAPAARIVTQSAIPLQTIFKHLFASM
jgi:hypothetical protein